MEQNNQLQVFRNSDFGELSVAKINGEDLFNLSNVCYSLGYTKVNSRGKIYLRKDKIENICSSLDITGVSPSDTNIKIDKNIDFENIFIIEDSLYDLILESKAKNARKFRKWVTSEVLPSIRQNGAYISDNITEEQENKLDKYSSTRKIKETFKTCNMETIEQEYKECMIYNKYKNGKEKNSIQNNIVKALEERKQQLMDGNKGAFALAIAESINIIKKKQLETNNKSRGQRIAYKDKKINELENKLNEVKPRDEEYVVINTHPMSNNYLYQTIQDEWTGETKTVKTKQYSNWIYHFPKHELKNKEDLNINWDEPIVLFLKYDCLDRFDVDNFSKSSIDMIMNRIYCEDDNIVKKTVCEKNKSVHSYKDGKIYVCIKNI